MRLKAVFFRNTVAIGTVVLYGCAGPPDPITDTERGAGAGERVDHPLAFQGAQLNAPFDKPFVELGGMPLAALLGVAGDPREVEHVAGNPTAKVRSSVAVLLSPGRDPDGIGVKWGVVAPEPQERPVVVA